ncbi:MAG: response regulator [Candidatus Marithrix sp.]
MKIKTKLLLGFLSIVIIIVISGILGIIETNRLYVISKNIGIKNAPLADAAMEIKLTATTAHLWFEEIIVGMEEKEVIEKVWKLLDDSLWYVNAIISGGKNTKGIFYPVNDNIIEAKLLSIKNNITKFREIAQLRFQNNFGRQELQDKDLDDKFDNVFNKFITETDEVEKILHAKIASDTEIMQITANRSNITLIVATLFGVVIAIMAAFYISYNITLQVGGEPTEIAKITEQVANGNLDIDFKSATGIYAAIQIMVKKLQAINYENKQQNWLKIGQTQLNEKMSGEQNIIKLTKNIITFLTNYIDGQVGVFYLLHNSKEKYVQMVSNYGYIETQGIPNEFKFGEGLVGQVALECKPIFRIHTQDECTTVIQSTLTRALLQHIIIIPFLYEGKLKGIIEIGTTREFTKIQRNFLEKSMLNIGIAINTANSRVQMHELLEQSQQQAEELQRTNEELRSQSVELQNQSEELQAQQEELRQNNEVLEERTKDLEYQKFEMQEKNQALETSKIEMEKIQIEMEKTQAAIVIKAEEIEVVSKYKSEFLANMSHELRTPLNSLLILSQLLAENSNDNLDKKQVEYAKTINSAGNDLLTLINDILDLSKVEAGKVDVQWEPVVLKDLLMIIERKFLPIANDKQIKFSFTITDDMPKILLTDSQRIKQIINNLLSNALKFTEEGEVKLIVQRPIKIPTNLDMLEPDKTISITVIDSGIGIPDDKQQSIFEAFQQADGSTSRRYGGTGLGLSISRKLAHLLGGELTLVSKEDQGSTFTLYLPEKYDESFQELLKISELTEPSLLTKEYQSPNAKLLADDRNDLSSKDKTILIIEDDRKFANIIRDLAHDKGFKCLLAEDGIIGLQLAIEHKPSAIILDIGLPKLDGLTVMEKLKNNADIRHIPVHFMSATDQSIDAKKMGAIGYLVKPINMEKLQEAFQKIESFLAKTIKTLLIVADSKPNQQKIIDLVTDKNLQIEISINSENACQKLLTKTYDCVILDMDLEQGLGSKLLERMQQEKGQPCKIPIIVYANRDLTTEEKTLLLHCSDEIPIKHVSSPEFLVDEVTLFLHQIESDLSINKRNMLHMVHDKKAILKGKKVLIVDDDERNIFALATILENHDAEIICGVNGKEGLELLEYNQDIAIVLMDIMMPEMDGYEAIQKIRTQKKHDKLPIIALTAKAMKDDKAKCIAAGANDYLAKPIDTDKLLSLMRVWLYR